MRCVCCAVLGLGAVVLTVVLLGGIMLWCVVLVCAELCSVGFEWIALCRDVMCCVGLSWDVLLLCLG